MGIIGVAMLVVIIFLILKLRQFAVLKHGIQIGLVEKDIRSTFIPLNLNDLPESFVNPVVTAILKWKKENSDRCIDKIAYLHFISSSSSNFEIYNSGLSIQSRPK